jgi:phosphoribosylglycinamide formyltransferase-1
MKRLVVVISGRGSNLDAIVSRCASERWPAEICLVVSNRPQAQGLDVARSHGLDTQVVDHTVFAERSAFDAALCQAIEACAPDLVVLAGFMRILSADTCRRLDGRMLNIHPSLLPSFRGMHTHRQAIEAGVRVHGCTVHAVTAELDHGAILAQAAVPVLPDDDEARLSARVLRAEHMVYPMAVASVLSGRCRLERGRWVDHGHGTFDHAFTPWLLCAEP